MCAASGRSSLARAAAASMVSARPKPNSEVRDSSAYGVLQLTLHPDSYDYRFVPAAGYRFTDYGRTTCSPVVANQSTPTATPRPSATATPRPSATPIPTATPTGETRTFALEADTRLEENAPTTNFGMSSRLRVNGAPEPIEQSVLRVKVAGLTQPVISARLRLYALSPTTRGPSVYRISNDWSETGVTWNARPVLQGSPLATVTSIATNTWVEYDVSAAITGNGTYSLALVGTSTDGVDYASRQGSAPPQLVVTTR